jgi:diguanylate cyclase (GGDEF)-like protein/putative nucleotidyltransferase with HDIG domain
VGTQSENEVFWRADGTYFDTVYYSYPQFKNGEMIGAVVTFMDNTERKRTEEHIRFLSCHDSLTGLYNRMYFEDALKTIDIKKNIPISIIFGDLNGLKLTNDIFGHAAGDALIKKSAEILKKVCRDEDVVARVGGDEFIILLPNTDQQTAEMIIQRVQDEFAEAKMSAIKCSMSMGYDTKTSSKIDIARTLENAENSMYKDKTNNRKAVNEQMIKTIVDALHEKSAEEHDHAVSVSQSAQALGKELGLSEVEIKRLKKAGFLHDIGKVVEGDEHISNIEPIIQAHKIHQHAVVGFRILNLFDDTLDIANIVYSHHERWDGNGYPKGLKAYGIPLLARIIAITEGYDWLIRKKGMTADEAIGEIIAQAGTKYDPELVEVFSQIVRNKSL